jgi:hypothetical protein
MRTLGLVLLFCGLSASRSAGALPGDDIISNVARVPVDSSALASVGYSKHLQVLEVEFRTGAVYRYFDVPENVFHELLDAESKAGYYNVNIRGHYESVHVKPGTSPEESARAKAGGPAASP